MNFLRKESDNYADIYTLAYDNKYSLG